MDDKTFLLLKWVVGIFLGMMAAMGSYILYLHSKQSKERKDDREERMKMSEKSMDAINRNSDIVQGLKTLLENRR